MKLFTTITSERGKPVTKSGNDFILFEIQDEKRNTVSRIELKYHALNGSLNTYDEVEVRYYIVGGKGYKVIDDIKIPHGIIEENQFKDWNKNLHIKGKKV